MFAEVLRLPDGAVVFTDDDFFVLGGDSILAARVVSRALGKDLRLTLRDVFEKRTVQQLAQVIEGPAIGPAVIAEPVPLTPSSVLDRLRESGEGVDAWIHTECAVVPPADPATIAKVVGALVDSVDALRLRVATPNRRLWVAEVAPVGTVDAAELLVVGEDVLDLEGARTVATSRVDVQGGRPLALVAVYGESTMTLVLAVHAAAADRAATHRLLSRLERSLRREEDPSSETSALAPVLEGIEAAGEREDAAASADWKAYLARAVPPGDGWAGDGFVEFGVPSCLDPDGARSAIAAALEVHAQDGASRLLVDYEVALTPQDVVGPLTATTPRVAGGGEPDRPALQFPLLRFHNRNGRRALRRGPAPALLVTRQFGRLPVPTVREGIELAYPAVLRYRVDDTRLVVTLLGWTDEAAGGLERALRSVLGDS
jgi:hypothetical protein